jgi:hypothetical protein
MSEGLREKLQQKTIICFAANGDQIEMLDPKDTLGLVDSVVQQIQEKATCSLVDFRPSQSIAFSPKTKEPYLTNDFDPCTKRICKTCDIKTQHLVVKLSDVLVLLLGKEGDKKRE